MVETQTHLDQALQENQPDLSALERTLAKSGYVVDAVIGRGSHAVVKKAFWAKLKTTVAIKIISKANTSGPVGTKNVLRELDAIRALRHENIINFIEIIETNMRIYIVMQYAEKGSLLELLKKQHKLPEPTAQRYFGQLMEAIHYLHSSGFVHRDVKLENIVLDAKDQVKLIDFGFACRVRDEGTDVSRLLEPYMSTTYCGSLAYASPELLRFKPYDPMPVDIWACGVVQYALLFGSLPFPKSDDAAIMRKHIARGVIFPTTVTVSEEAMLLMQQIFVPAKRRISSIEIKKSPWLRLKRAEEL